MKNILLLILAASSCAFAQSQGNVTTQSAPAGGNILFYQSQSISTAGAVTVGAFGKGPNAAPVQGAPYSATVTNESIQTLADGNRIVITTSGAIARDSLGRTRQEAALPSIGNLSATNAPHLVFIQDPVTQTSYTLNLSDKTAQKMPTFPAVLAQSVAVGGPIATIGSSGATLGALPLPPPPSQSGPVLIQRSVATSDQDQATTEDLGSQSVEDILAIGTRTTTTIPAGQIGNDKPITIVTEVWTSPDLKAIVSSKRTDPRMGEQTFKLTNIARTEPDPSLFTVPGDFKIVDGPQPILYGPKQ